MPSGTGASAFRSFRPMRRASARAIRRLMSLVVVVTGMAHAIFTAAATTELAQASMSERFPTERRADDSGSWLSVAMWSPVEAMSYSEWASPS